MATLCIGMALMVAACGGASSAGDSNAGPGDSSAGADQSSGGGPAANTPDPCTLLTPADISSAFTTGGLPLTYGTGVLDTTHDPGIPVCTWSEPNGFTMNLQLCTTARCDYESVKLLGFDPVTGVGDDAFFQQGTCGSNGLANHAQLSAKAKGLVFKITSACHALSAMAQDKSDQMMIDLMKLAISRA